MSDPFRTELARLIGRDISFDASGSEHIPPTSTVRVCYTRPDLIIPPGPNTHRGPEFDRWLAAHDAQVRAETAEQIAAAIEAQEHTRDEARSRLRHGHAMEWVVGHTEAIRAAAIIARDHATGGAP